MAGIASVLHGGTVNQPGEELNSPVDMRELLASATLRPIHLRVFAICLLTSIADGMDNQSIGFAAPAIAAATGIPAGAFGPIFAAGTLGVLVGAFLLGPLADRIGRKRALTVSTSVFALFTFLTALADSTPALAAIRFFAGIGLGGAMPCFLTLMSDYAPYARRALAIGALWCGYPVGGVVGGLIGARVLPEYGWHAVFTVGAGVGLLAAVMQSLFLPESLLYLVRRGVANASIRRVAAKVAPNAVGTATTFFIAQEDNLKRAAAPVTALFAGGRLPVTLLIWIPLFFTFFLTTFFTLWAPSLFRQSGINLGTVAAIAAAYNLAAVPSQAFTGIIIDRSGPFAVISIAYLAMTAVMVAIAPFMGAAAAVTFAMVGVGFLIGPEIAGMLFLASAVYPPAIRSTGMGWALGVGRTGQVFGSFVIGAAISGGFTPGQIIVWAAVAPLIAMGCLAGLKCTMHRAGIRP